MLYGLQREFGTNKPWLFYLQKKNRPLAMAGIYDHWQNPKTVIKDDFAYFQKNGFDKVLIAKATADLKL